jgi:hypothetical protein
MRFDSLDTLPGLLPASFRGVDFHVADASSEVGRRVLEYLFPGVDAAEYDDFGVAPGVITIDALIVGDDYKVKAKILQAAFETAGPGTLIHPWLGPMTVIVEEPAMISLSARELRVVRMNARFKRYSLSLTSGSGLFDIATIIATIISLATALSSAVGTKVISATRVAAVTRSTRLVTSAITSLTPPTGSAAFLPTLKTLIAKTVPGTADEYGAWVTAAAVMFADVSDTSAVAPAAEAVIVQQPSADSILGISLSLASAMNAHALDAPADADRALLTAASSQFVAQGSVQAAYVSFASRREALAYRATALSAIDGLIDQLEGFGSTSFQAEVSALIGALRDLQAAIVSNINEIIGHLPNVLVFKTTRSIDAWQLALHVAGDQPSRLEEVYRDIVARNDPKHPSAMEAGNIEVAELT